jgi:hypothetical protein
MNLNRLLSTNSELAKKCVNRESIDDFFKSGMSLMSDKQINDKKIKNVIIKFRSLLKKNENSLDCLMNDKFFSDQMCNFLSSRQVSNYLKNNIFLNALNKNPDEFKSIFLLIFSSLEKFPINKCNKDVHNYKSTTLRTVNNLRYIIGLNKKNNNMLPTVLTVSIVWIIIFYIFQQKFNK